MLYPIGTRVKILKSRQYAGKEGVIVSIHREPSGYTEFGIAFGHGHNVTAWFLFPEIEPLTIPKPLNFRLGGAAGLSVPE